MTRKTKALTLADLKPAPYNPRKIGKKAMRGLMRSLSEFGDISGIVWNARTGHVVAGHQRLAALKREHKDNLTISNGIIKTPDGSEYLIRVVDWPAEKERTANVAANNPHVQGYFTEDVDGVLSDLAKDLDDLALFSELRLDALMVDLPSLDADEAETNETEEPAEKPDRSLPPEAYQIPLPEFVDAHDLVILLTSGGKDSVATALWCRDNLEKQPLWVYHDTGIEWPETLGVLQKQAEMIGAELKVTKAPGAREWHNLLRLYGFPNYGGPGKLWCRQRLKTNPWWAFLKQIRGGRKLTDICVLAGIRAEESSQRAKLPQRTLRPDGCHGAVPIHELTEAEVWKRVKASELPTHPGYAVSDRTGCFCCPNNSPQVWQRLREQRPDLWSRHIADLAYAAECDLWRRDFLRPHLARVCHGLLGAEP